jgi:hypothetical protein
MFIHHGQLNELLGAIRAVCFEEIQLPKPINALNHAIQSSPPSISHRLSSKIYPDADLITMWRVRRQCDCHIMKYR